MKPTTAKRTHSQKFAAVCRPTVTTDQTHSGVPFLPSADDVAACAYLTYLSQGSLPGQDVRHWLDAEAQLLVDRHLGRAPA